MGTNLWTNHMAIEHLQAVPHLTTAQRGPLQMVVELFCPKACGILLVPESHTRNIHYLENLATFVHLLELAGFQVNLGSLLAEGTAPPTIPMPSGRPITLFPLTR